MSIPWNVFIKIPDGARVEVVHRYGVPGVCLIAEGRAAVLELATELEAKAKLCRAAAEGLKDHG